METHITSRSHTQKGTEEWGQGTSLRDHKKPTTAGRQLHAGHRNTPHHTVHREHTNMPSMKNQPWRPSRDLYDGHQEAITAATGIYYDHGELHHSSHSKPTMMTADDPSQ